MKLPFKIFLKAFTVVFLVGSLLVLGGFAQEIKKLKPSPFLGAEKGQTLTFMQLQSNFAKVSKKECPKGNKLVVDAVEGPYFDIQSAIAAAFEGDKIEVMPGIYPGFFVVDKNCIEIKGKKDKKND